MKALGLVGLVAVALAGCKKVECGEGTFLDEETNSCLAEAADPPDLTAPTGTVAVTVSGEGPFDIDWTPADSDASAYLVVRFPLDAWGMPDQNTSYAAGDAFPGGGEVVYVGAEMTATDDPGTGRYRYAVWLADEAGNYGAYGADWGTDPFDGGNITLSIDVAARTVTITDAGGLDLEASLLDAQVDTNLPYSGVVQLTARNGTALPLYNLKAVFATDPTVTGTIIPRLDFPTIDNLPGNGGDPGPVRGVEMTGRPFFRFGHGGIAPGDIADSSFGIAATEDATLTATLELRTAPLVIAGHNWDSDLDACTTVFDPDHDFGEAVECIASPVDAYAFGGQADDYARLSGGAVSPSGVFLYVGSFNAPWIGKIDLTTQHAVAGVRLDTEFGKGSIGFVRLGPDGYLYAVLNDGRHGYRWSYYGRSNAWEPTEPEHAVSLLKLDPETFEIVDRVEIVEGPIDTTTGSTRGGVGSPEAVSLIGRRFGISPDGRFAAVPLVANLSGTDPGGWLAIVDLAEMAVDHLVSLEGIANPASAAIDASGKAYAGGDYGADNNLFAMVDVATGAVSSINVFPVRGNSSTLDFKAFETGPDGAVYVGAGNDVDGLNNLWRVSNGSLTRLAPANAGYMTQPMGLGFLPDGRLMAMSYDDYEKIDIIDAATGEVEHYTSSYDSDSVYGNWIVATPY